MRVEAMLKNYKAMVEAALEKKMAVGECLTTTEPMILLTPI